MAESQNADLSRKFITRRKSINFGSVLVGHKGRNISKISEFKIRVTFLNNFRIFQL